jgi:hypothetical protein
MSICSLKNLPSLQSIAVGKRRTLLIVTAFVGLAITLAVLMPHDDEPRYNGRTLEQWIQINVRSPQDPQAREAIITITTNSVPLLVQRRLTHDTRLESWLKAKLPAFLRKNTIISRFLYRKTYRAACAVRAFKVSGTNAACAIPAMVQLLNASNALQMKVEATIILSEIGPPALPSIQHAMRSPDSLVRALAIQTTEELGTNAAPAIPDLLAALSDPDIEVRTAATNALETLAPETLQPH